MTKTPESAPLPGSTLYKVRAAISRIDAALSKIDGGGNG
jgi:hypothetical protein